VPGVSVGSALVSRGIALPRRFGLAWLPKVECAEAT